MRELRTAAGLSQPELAERAGMNRFGVAKLEQGVREPSWSTIKALCLALGVKCDAFMLAPATQPRRGPGRPPKEKATAPAAKGKKQKRSTKQKGA